MIGLCRQTGSNFSLKKVFIRSYMENPFKDVEKKKESGLRSFYLNTLSTRLGHGLILRVKALDMPSKP